MTALTSVGANTVAMTGGLLVSHDAIGSWATQIAVRVLALCSESSVPR